MPAPSKEFEYAMQRGAVQNEAGGRKPHPRSSSPAQPQRRSNMESDDSSLLAYAKQRSFSESNGTEGPQKKIQAKAQIDAPWVPAVGAARPYANESDKAAPPNMQQYNRKREVPEGLHPGIPRHGDVPFGTDAALVGDQRRSKQSGAFKQTTTQPYGTDNNSSHPNATGMQSKVRTNCAAAVDHLSDAYQEPGNDYSKINAELYGGAKFGRVHKTNVPTNVFNPTEDRSHGAERGIQINGVKNANEPWGKLGDPSGTPGHFDARRGPKHFQEKQAVGPGPIATDQEVYYPPKRRVAGKVNQEWAKDPNGTPFATNTDKPDHDREQVNKGIKSSEDRYAVRPSPFGVDPNYGIPFGKEGVSGPEIGGNVGNWGLKATEQSREQRPSPFAREDGVPVPGNPTGLRMGDQRMHQGGVPFGNPGDVNEGSNPHGVTRGKVSAAQPKTDPFSWN